MKKQEKQEYGFWKRMGLYFLGLLIVATAFSISSMVIIDFIISFVIIKKEVE